MHFYHLERDAVVSYKGNARLTSSQTFTVQELDESIRRNKNSQYDPWFEEGMPCKVMRPGQGWQKGRLRITVEFCPDESVAIDE